jgi:hypothetical protein
MTAEVAEVSDTDEGGRENERNSSGFREVTANNEDEKNA